MKRRYFLSVCLLACAVLTVAAGTAERHSWTGKISVSGNEPFTFVALTDKSGHQWRLTGAPVTELRAQAQGLWVSVYGNENETGVIAVERWTPESP